MKSARLRRVVKGLLFLPLLGRLADWPLVGFSANGSSPPGGAHSIYFIGLRNIGGINNGLSRIQIAALRGPLP